MGMILELMVWLVAMSPLVLLAAFFMWFAARRVTGKPCSYNRCCIATLISSLIQVALGLILGLAFLPVDNEPAIITVACIEILAGFSIHVWVICRWLSVSGRAALLITLYQALLGVIFLGCLGALWFISLIVTGT